MIYRFKTKDCPDADGRTPVAGEQKWTVYFPTEDGGRVYVEMGREGREAMRAMLAQEDADDAKEGVCPNCGGTEHVDPVPGTVGRRCVKCCNVKTG